MDLNRSYQLLVYADDINLLSKNVNSKNTLNPSETSKEGGLEVNVQKAVYVHISHHQDTIQNVTK
jgi:hypothetical protein